MDQQVEAKAVGGQLASQELHDEPSPFDLSATDPMGPQRPVYKPDRRSSTAVAMAAPAVPPPWTPSMDARRSRRRLGMPTALARLLSGDGATLSPGSAWPSAPAGDAELECYLIEGRAYRRQRLPFGQGHLAQGVARRGGADDVLWTNYMALDAGQKACVNRLLRRKTRKSTRPRTCVAITPCAGGGVDAVDGIPAAATEAAAAAAAAAGGGGRRGGKGGMTTPPPPKSPNFLVFLAVGRPVAPVRFRDPLGRRFEFSFELCRTWAGMEDLLLDCFPCVAADGDSEASSSNGIDARVRRGHYDLLGPDGHIVLPMVWESIVRPGWRVSMVLWPDVFAWDPRAPPGPRAVPASLWQKALGVLRAPFERARHPRPPRAGPAASVERQREGPREVIVLRQPRLGGGAEEARGQNTEASRHAALPRFGTAPEVFHRHSSDMPGRPPPPLLGDYVGDTRSWYVTSLPRHMASPPMTMLPRRNAAAWETGRRLSPISSAAAPEEGSSSSSSSDGSAVAAASSSLSKASSSLRTCPSVADDGEDDGRASRSSSMPDGGSETLETVSLGKGIDDLLGRWTSAGAETASEADAGGKASTEKEGEGSETKGE